MQATYLAMERMSKDKGGKVSFHFCMKWSMVVIIIISMIIPTREA